MLGIAHYGNDPFYAKVFGLPNGDFYSDLNGIVYDDSSGAMVAVGTMTQVQDYGLNIGGLSSDATQGTPALVPTHVFASAADQNAFFNAFNNATPAQQSSMLQTYTIPPTPPPSPLAPAYYNAVGNTNSGGSVTPLSSDTYGANGGIQFAPAGSSLIKSPIMLYGAAALLTILLVRR